LFKKILEKTTDVNAQDDEGDTALHLAILCESKTAVNILLKRKDVDVSLSNKNEDTAFDLCRKWKDIPDNFSRLFPIKQLISKPNKTPIISEEEKLAI
jgi:ankyrin repeat protein